ncbi:MAG: hypothetical protein ACRDAM_02445 [Casimicrobium sp.]
MKKWFAIIVLAVAAAAAFFKWQSDQSSSGDAKKTGSVDAAQKGAVAAGALPPSAVLKIDPRAGSAQGVSSVAGGSTTNTMKRGQLPSAMSPMMSDFVNRKNFPELYNKAIAMPDNGEALYLRAAILSSCATQTDRPANSPPRKTPEERRAAFVASLPPNHPDTAARIAAYDAANPDVCGPLRSLQYTQQELEGLYAKARELKDPSALAPDLNCEIAATADPRTNGGSRGAELTDARFNRMRELIASRSPIGVRTGVGMLANTYRNGAIRIGRDGEAVDSIAMGHVANMLACQYGADCNVDVLRACASEGKCNASNYEDYLAFYRLSPSMAQVVDSYRTQLTQMIDSNDFSALQMVKGEQPTDSTSLFGYFSCPQTP